MEFKTFAIVLVTCAFSMQHAVTTGVKYTSCGINRPITLNQLVVTPDPPKIGKPLTITLHAHSSEEVTDGKAVFEIQGKGAMSIIHLKQEKELCGLLPNGCPIRKGDFTITGTIGNRLTALAPAGAYEVELKVKDRNGERELLCVDLEVTFH